MVKLGMKQWSSKAWSNGQVRRESMVKLGLKQ